LAPESAEFGKITHNNGYSSFKIMVISFSTNQNPVYDSPYVSKSNLPPILHRFRDMVDFGQIFGVDRGAFV